MKKNLIGALVFWGGLIFVSLLFAYKIFATTNEVSGQPANNRPNVDTNQEGLTGYLYGLHLIENAKAFKIFTAVGTLYKEPDDAVYLEDGGYKFHVPNTTTFYNFGFSWGNVISGTSSKPYGGLLSNLIKGSGSEIYAMDQGTRRHIESMVSFNAWQFKWETISFLSDAFIDTIPSSSFISQLTKSPNDPKVYLIENGKRRWITSMDVFKRNGYRWEYIGLVSDGLLNSKPQGADVK